MVNVFNHADIPEQVRAEGIVPQELPHYGWDPFQLSVFLPPAHPDQAYHSHPRRHRPGDV